MDENGAVVVVCGFGEERGFGDVRRVAEGGEETSALAERQC